MQLCVALDKQSAKENLELAKEFKLPLVIHCRQAEKELVQILKEKGIEIGISSNFKVLNNIDLFFFLKKHALEFDFRLKSLI